MMPFLAVDKVRGGTVASPVMFLREQFTVACASYPIGLRECGWAV
jgi:hypothetical protein